MSLFDITNAAANCIIAENRFNSLILSGCKSESKLAVAARELERRQMALRLMQD